MSLDFVNIINILSILACSISATSTAMKKGLDIFGIAIISFVTSIGGGTLRDLLIGHTPVLWLTDPTAIIVSLIGTVATFIFGRFIKKLNYTLFIFDAIGLGLFSLIGIHKGMEMDFSYGVCLVLGAITGSFGGVLRDVLLNEIPLIFRKEIYITASLAGGMLYYILLHVKVQDSFAQSISICTIVAIRVIAVKYHLSLPQMVKEKID
jgi:uncharacterized membrane protein YeiH